MGFGGHDGFIAHDAGSGVFFFAEDHVASDEFIEVVATDGDGKGGEGGGEESARGRGR